MSASDCAYEGCGRPVYQNPKYPETDKCIFHCEEKDPSKFRAYMYEYMKTVPISDFYDMRGWVFVGNDWLELLHKLNGRSQNDFSDVTFVNCADFRTHNFESEAIFHGAKFKGNANFSGMAFLNKADFSCAIFDETPNFSNREFGNIAVFSEAQFKNGANFENATFWNDGVFAHTQLHGKINLSHTSFAGIGLFESSRICGLTQVIWPGMGRKKIKTGEDCRYGDLLFSNLKFEEFESERPVLDFRNNSLQDISRLQFQDTDMKLILLEGTDCKRIEFNHVRWPQLWHRLMVGDEFHARQKKENKRYQNDWNKTVNSYQQLTSNYRERLNHTVANDFESGIFSCRLKSAKQGKNRDNKWLLRAYWGISYFGCNTWQPVWIALILTALFAWTYCGFFYGGWVNWPHNWDVSSVWDSLVAAMRVVSLDRAWFTREVDTSGMGSFARFFVSGLAIVQTILTATLVTLFIFAVRRRFKHSE